MFQLILLVLAFVLFLVSAFYRPEATSRITYNTLISLGLASLTLALFMEIFPSIR